MIGVAVVGCGIVGSGVVEILAGQGERLRLASGEDIRLKYVADVREARAPEGARYVRDYGEALADPEVSVVVETVGGTRAAKEITRRALESGRHVVTSNKELVSSHGDEMLAIARRAGVRYLYEAAAGGGIPALFPIMELLAANEITAFSGIVNGTTNYILTRMADSGQPFSAAMGEARELGYVEADPSADIDGHDARRKMAILANACFGARLSDEAKIPFEGIARVTHGDMLAARERGYEIKLIAHGERAGEGWTGWVASTLVMSGHPLYAIKDVFNAILVSASYAGDVMFYGRGAGSLPTASAVVGDILQIAKNPRTRAPELPGVPEFASPCEEGERALIGGREMRVLR